MTGADSTVAATEAFEVVRGVTYDKASSSTEPVDGHVPILRAGNIADGQLNTSTDLVFVPPAFVKAEQFLKPGDIVMATSSGSIAVVGKTALLRASWHGSFGAFCACLRPRPGWNPAFIGYYLQTLGIRRTLSERARGVNINNLRREHIESLEVPKPRLELQHRIVAAIETHFSRLDAAVASLTRAKANVKRARASVLKAAVEGRLVPTEAALARAEGRDYEPAAVLLDRILAERKAAWAASGARGKYKEPVKPETEGLPGLPEGWCWASVEQLFNQSLGKMLDKAKNTGTLRPYLRNANVRWFGFDLSDTKMMRVEEHELERVSVAQGDIVVCEGGEPGRAAVWTSPNESFVIQKACHRLRPIMAISSPFFVIALRESAHSGRLAERFTGSTIKHLTGQNLVPFPMPLPPLAEQHRIVAEVDRRLSVLDALDATLDANLARCDRLRQAVLKRAFEGRLVPAEADAPLLAAEPQMPLFAQDARS
jgi:type I restriction enzyme S subunit